MESPEEAHVRVVLSVLLSGVAVSLAACTAPTVSLSTADQAIIDGENSPSSEDAVVLLVHVARQGIGSCTGTLVAPNLVLTALHCVSETDQSSACDEAGKPLAGGDVGRTHTANDMVVFTGSTRPEFERGIDPKIAARGLKVLVPDTDTICANDIALIVLDRNVEGAKIAPLRLDADVISGETVTSIGWGVTDNTDFPNMRQRRLEVPVVNVGPLRDRRGRSLGPSEFEVGESICSGDSGGPAIATSTGAVLGVVSRGGNGTQDPNDPAAGCTGAQAFNIYTGVAGHKDFILSAFDAAAATPWVEGSLNPILSVFGSACTAAEECQQGVCVQTAGDAPTCNLDCSASACPDGYECTDVAASGGAAEEGGKACTVVPPPVKKTITTTSCDATPVTPASSSLTALGFAVAALALTRRSARR